MRSLLDVSGIDPAGVQCDQRAGMPDSARPAPGASARAKKDVATDGTADCRANVVGNHEPLKPGNVSRSLRSRLQTRHRHKHWLAEHMKANIDRKRALHVKANTTGALWPILTDKLAEKDEGPIVLHQRRPFRR